METLKLCLKYVNVKQYNHQNGLNGSGVFIDDFEHNSHIVFLIISISELEKVKAEKKIDFLIFFLMRQNIVTRNG